MIKRNHLKPLYCGISFGDVFVDVSGTYSPGNEPSFDYPGDDPEFEIEKIFFDGTDVTKLIKNIDSETVSEIEIQTIKHIENDQQRRH